MLEEERESGKKIAGLGRRGKPFFLSFLWPLADAKF